MDPNPETDKYAKAKIEDQHPDFPLRLSLLTPDGVSSDNFCYMKVFEEDGKALKLAEAAASGVKVVRKLHRIRNKELVKFIDKDFEGMKDIHVISEATIGVVADAESNQISHSFLDMVGTVDEVNLAEQLILDNVLKTYSSLCYPVILMPAGICWDKMNIPRHMVFSLLGTNGSNVLRMEMESGAWINVQIDQGPNPGVWEWERVVNIFGTRETVNRAKSLIQSVISDLPGQLAATEKLNALLQEFREPSCHELIDGKQSADGKSDKKKRKLEETSWGQTYLRIKKSERSKQTEGESEKEKKQQHEFKEPTWSQTFGRVIPCRGEPEGSKQTEDVKDKESGELEKGKQQQVEEGGSGLSEKEKQQQDVEDLQHKKSEDERGPESEDFGPSSSAG